MAGILSFKVPVFRLQALLMSAFSTLRDGLQNADAIDG